MCGVIGIYNSDNVAQELYNGLLLLQHRGQDSCGILTADDETIYLQKFKGLVSENFNEDVLSTFSGRSGIAQVRYPTIGSSSLLDAQPFYLNYPLGIGMAHNGNVVNLHELRRELKENRRVVISKCDVEVILNVLAEELIKVSSETSNSFEKIKKAVKGVFERINGAYSVVTVSIGNRMVAFRDPKGIRPLVMGRKKKSNGEWSYAFSSETVPLDFLGFEIVRDVKPGEVVYINSKGVVKSEVLTDDKPQHCMFEWVYFSRPDSVIENLSVYEARRNLGKQLAHQIKEKNLSIDVVMPVPDSSRPAALACAEELGIPYREGLIKNRYSQRTFIMPTQELRENAVKMKLSPVIKEIKGKSILLVDDSIVRGTTSKKIVRMLKKSGAREVHFASTAPPIKKPCFYGVDMSTTEELIAGNKSIEEIKEFIKADSLTYLSVENLKKAIPRRICTACLDGSYPTDVEKYAEEYSENRKQEKISQ